MKVLHLVPAMEQGGVETVVLALNRVVVGNGWESVVVSKGGRLVSRLVADGGRHALLDVKSKNPLTYFSRAWKLRKLLKAEQPDLVCAHSRVPAWLFVGAEKIESLVGRPRQPSIPWITYAHGANSVSRYSAIMTKGDLTVTPSRFLADYLKSNYGLAEKKLRVVSPAVDSARFDPAKLDRDFIEAKRREWGIGPADFVVMAVGRITPLKGYETLIRAVCRLQSNNLKLVIVGDADEKHGEHLASLKRLADDGVVFAGGESKIPECLSIASVVVSSNTKKPETFGLSMAEALMMDRPVVAKAFGGALDIVRDGIDGVLVPVDATDMAEAFAEAIAKVRQGTFSGLRASALNRFDFGIMSAKTTELYQST